MKDSTVNNLTMSVDALAQELNKLTQEIIKLNERIEDVSTCARRRK